MLLSVITFIGYPVLMHNTLNVFNGSAELSNEFEENFKRHVNQIDNKQYRFFFQPSLKVRENSSGMSNLIDLIIEYTEAKLKPKALDNYKRHIQLILLNLAKSVMHRQWCMIPLDSKVFGKGKYENLSYRSFKRAIDTMQQLKLINVVKGKKYSQQPLRTAIQPQSILSHEALIMYLESFDDEEPPYASLNNGEDGYTPSEADLKVLSQDESDMVIINDFLLTHSWAAKSKMTRKYSGKIGLSGRIYCAFQQLPQRRIKVRQNCLINGEEIVEVDIKSSHIRLAVAQLYSEKLERDFYKRVYAHTDVYESKAKQFCQYVFSCDSREAALSAFKSKASSEHDFTSLETYILGRFPKLPVYQGWSKKAMNTEGEVLKKVMLQGVVDNIVALPIHDAVAVQVRHKEWAEKAMKDCWNDVVGFDGCEVG